MRLVQIRLRLDPLTQKQWSLCIALVLLNYIVYSSLITGLQGRSTSDVIRAMPPSSKGTPRVQTVEFKFQDNSQGQGMAKNTLPMMTLPAPDALWLTPVSTATPEPPVIHTTSVVNVRTGPGLAYPVIGMIPEGEFAKVLGVSADRQWWQISYGAQGEGAAWISTEFSEMVDLEKAEVVEVAQASSPPPKAKASLGVLPSGSMSPDPSSPPKPPPNTTTPISTYSFVVQFVFKHQIGANALETRVTAHIIKILDANAGSYEDLFGYQLKLIDSNGGEHLGELSGGRNHSTCQGCGDDHWFNAQVKSQPFLPGTNKVILLLNGVQQAETVEFVLGNPPEYVHIDYFLY